MIPEAVVVTRSVTEVEIAVDAARRAGRSADARFKPWSFGVVTRPETFGVARITFAIAIVIDAVVALERLARAQHRITSPRPTVTGDNDAGTGAVAATRAVRIVVA